MTSQFENSKAIMVTHYQGLATTQLDELRAKTENMELFLKSQKTELLNLL